jgi:thiamine biosynthesis lipoprotein
MGAGAVAETTFPAMGTEVTVLIDDDTRTDHAAAVRELFRRWEETLSRFRPDSELSRVNAAGGDPAPAGPLLRSVTAEALRAAAATGGVFDPTMGRRMSALGYGESLGTEWVVPRAALLGRHLPDGWRDVRVDDDAGTVSVPAGLALDLGGIAKGMAVDAAAELLRGAGVRSALVSAGGDMRATGEAGGWQVAFEDAPAEQITLTSGAVATSSLSRRNWVHEGIRRHHLIDPRTGLPARSGLRSASVAADTCVRAEVAAKAAFVLGRDRGARFLERLGAPGLLTATDGTVTRVGSWPEGRRA